MKKADDLYVSSADDTCWVSCECGEKNFYVTSRVTKCPKCGRGYRVEFVVWQYEPGEEEKDEAYTG